METFTQTKMGHFIHGLVHPMLMTGSKGGKTESLMTCSKPHPLTPQPQGAFLTGKKHPVDAHISGHTSFSQVCKKCERYTVAALVTRQVFQEGRILIG